MGSRGLNDGVANGKNHYHKMKAKIGNGVESITEEAPLLTGPPSPTRSRPPPPDLCFSTYVIFYLLGVGHLLPWNFFITAKTVGSDLLVAWGHTVLVK